jgi:hypothetical protein
MTLGIPDGVFAGIVSGIVTLIVAVIGGIVQRRNTVSGSDTTTRVEFYKNLMQRVADLEEEVGALREQLMTKDRREYELMLKIQQLEMKAEGP